MIKITVFTPTYNRSSCLPTLYKSLKKQTIKDFEWIIVDDGSSDNTEEIVTNWMNDENEFIIRYFRKPNGGKHTAINEGVKLSKGELFFIVDSYDYLNYHAIEEILKSAKNIPENGYAGLAFNRLFPDNTMVGKSFPGNYVDCTSLERRKNSILGDKAEIFFSEILKKYPFPEFEDENFLTEAVVWNRIANDNLKIRWFNIGIYICQYRADGLSMNSNIGKCLKGYTLFIKELLSYQSTTFIDKVIWCGVYVNIAKKRSMSYQEIARLLNTRIQIVCFSHFLYMGKCTMRSLINPDHRARKLRTGEN